MQKQGNKNYRLCDYSHKIQNILKVNIISNEYYKVVGCETSKFQFCM